MDSTVAEMKPTIAVDEMFPEGGAGFVDMEESGSSSGHLLDGAPEKHVHTDFYNDFEDLFDDDDDEELPVFNN